jgi:hypothetical protein
MLERIHFHEYSSSKEEEEYFLIFLMNRMRDLITATQVGEYG